MTVSVASVCGCPRERRFHGLVIVLQGGLVAAEHDVILGTRVKPTLYALGHREILIFDSRHRQIEVVVPMPPGAVGQRRFGRVERNIHPCFINPVAGREQVPGLEMILGHNQDSVREQEIDDDRLTDQIPLRLGQRTQLAD